MRFATTHNRSTQKSVTGFTLVELLVVIIIVAILVAILFPVYKKALETSRQATSISNLHQIQQALVKYQQDHDGKSPSVLFGYAVAGASMQNAYSTAAAAAAASVPPTSISQFPGLYPTYIKDYTVFTDPDNTKASLTATQSAGVNSSNSDGSLNNTGSQTFYTADAYDLSPAVTSSGDLNYGQFDAWYETVWTGIAPGTPNTQLAIPHPDGATFITATTYHADKNGNVLLLFEDGTVRTLAGWSFYKAQSAPYVLKPTSN